MLVVLESPAAGLSREIPFVVLDAFALFPATARPNPVGRLNSVMSSVILALCLGGCA